MNDKIKEILYVEPGRIAKIEITLAFKLAIIESHLKNDRRATVRAVSNMVETCAKADVPAVDVMREILLEWK